MRSVLSPPLRAARLVLAALLASYGAPAALAQQTNPGDVIVVRQVTPRDAFVAVPKAEDPIVTKVETFPAHAFDASVVALVSDLDMTRVHGSGGVAATAVGEAVGRVALESLRGAQTAGIRTPIGSGATLETGGVAGVVTTTVTGALAPLPAALGALK